jgi:hypothetical protein
VDSALDEDESVLGIDIVFGPLEVLADVGHLLDQIGELLGVFLESFYQGVP